MKERLRSTFDNLDTRFRALPSRERWMIGMASVFVLFYLFYLIVWSPLLSANIRLRNQVNKQETLLAWVQSADKLIAETEGQQKTRAHPESIVSLLSVLKKGLTDAGLSASIVQLQQVSNDSLSLQLQKVSFDKATEFLLNIAETYELRIQQFTVIASKTPGLVQMDMVIAVS